jgi:predicted membrane protein
MNHNPTSPNKPDRANRSGRSQFGCWLAKLTPSICFGIVVDLVNTRQQSRLSWFDWCALVAAFFSVTLGSLLAVWAVKVLFWTSFQDASVVLKIFGALVCLALVAISGTMIWKTTRNYFSSKRPDERQVASCPQHW